jgi:hypothetical protein
VSTDHAQDLAIGATAEGLGCSVVPDGASVNARDEVEPKPACRTGLVEAGEPLLRIVRVGVDRFA